MPLPPLPGWQLPRLCLRRPLAAPLSLQPYKPGPGDILQNMVGGCEPQTKRQKTLALGLYKALPGRMVFLLGEFLDFSK